MIKHGVTKNLAGKKGNHPERTESPGYDPLETPRELAQIREKCEGPNGISDNVKPECWSALEFAIVNDFPDILEGRSNFTTNREQVLRFLFALSFYAINIFIQASLLWFIVKMLMMPAFKATQNLYRSFHLETFVNGEFSHSMFHLFDDEKKAQLCALALSQTYITKILVFLWMSQNMGEFVHSLSRMLVICKLPRLPEGTRTTEMVVDHKGTEQEEFWVICLDLKTKFFLQAFIYIPKMLIAIILGITGALWLLAAEDFEDLFLNSLALGFVTNVDEILASIFFPQFFIDDCLGPFAYRYYSPKKGDTKEHQMSYMLGIVKYLVTIGVVALLTTGRFQQVIPGYKGEISSICFPYLRRQLPWCLPFQRDCFPMDGE